MRRSLVIYFILIVLIFINYGKVLGDTIRNPNRIRFYEASKIRCSGRIISPGKSQQEVMDYCGEPIRTDRIHGEPYDAWVYRFGNSVYYLGFIDQELKRIRRTKCWQDNPDCR